MRGLLPCLLVCLAAPSPTGGRLARTSPCPVAPLRGGADLADTGTVQWASMLGIGRRRQTGKQARKGHGSAISREGEGPMDDIATAIVDKEAQVERLLGEMDDSKAAAEQGTIDQGQESDEIDLAVHLAPLSREELECLVAQLVAWRPEIGERVLEIAHKPADVGAIPYRVQQLTQARATPSEFAEEILPFTKKAHDYAQAGDIANARALAEALTRSIAAAYPRPDDGGHIALLWPEIESAFDEVCRQIGAKDPKENRALGVLLKRMQGHLSGYGPLFSDALRSLDRGAARALGAKSGTRKLNHPVNDYFGQHRIGKKQRKVRRHGVEM